MCSFDARSKGNLASPLAIGMMKKLNWTCIVGGVLVCAWAYSHAVLRR